MSFWVFIYRIAWVLLVVLIAIGIFSLFYPQYRQYRVYKDRQTELREQIRHENELIQTLKSKQHKFQHDPEYVEHIAHEMGLAKPNETIFQFVDDETNSTVPDAAPQP